MKKKNRSTIGDILHWAAVVYGVLGAATALVLILGAERFSSLPMAVGAALATLLITAVIMVLLLGVAELLHAVMRTAAAAEELVEKSQVPIGNATQSVEAPLNRRRRAPFHTPEPALAVSVEGDSEITPATWAAPAETKCISCHSFFSLPRSWVAEVVCPRGGRSMRGPD